MELLSLRSAKRNASIATHRGKEKPWRPAGATAKKESPRPGNWSGQAPLSERIPDHELKTVQPWFARTLFDAESSRRSAPTPAESVAGHIDRAGHRLVSICQKLDQSSLARDLNPMPAPDEAGWRGHGCQQLAPAKSANDCHE